jgi:hypothetical protein
VFETVAQQSGPLCISRQILSLYILFWLYVVPLHGREVLGLFGSGVGADVVCIQNILFEILCGGCIIISVDVVSHFGSNLDEVLAFLP